jgi:hypothetical protein
MPTTRVSVGEPLLQVIYKVKCLPCTLVELSFSVRTFIVLLHILTVRFSTTH